MKFVRDYARKHPEKYTELRKNLKSARSDLFYDEHVSKAVMNALGIMVLIPVLMYLVPYMGKLPAFSVLSLFDKILSYPLVYVIGSLIAGYVTYSLYIYSPKFKASSRKTNIDVMLPHVASFCYGMSKGGTTVYDIFKELSTKEHIYGEAAIEAGYIVRDVELLGSDLISAMKETSRTTPSPTFKEFLENLIPMAEGGANIHEYFSVKMDQYFEHAKKTQERFIKTLELICEVYVVAFVAVPIFLLITLITIGMLNASQSPFLYQMLYIGLPVGSIALLVIIDAISPKEDLGMKYGTHHLLKKTFSIREEDMSEEEYKKMVEGYEKKKRFRRIFDVLKNPFAPMVEQPLYALIIGVPLMVLPFVLLEEAFDKQAMLGLILVLFPTSVAFEYKLRRLAKIEKSIPDFLRRLAEINEIGLTLKHAIGMILRSDIGVLSTEVKRIWLDLEWGAEMKEALTRFEDRVGTPALRRAVTLIVKASEVNDSTKDVLLIAAEDAENMMSMRAMRFETGFIYLATVYIAFGTFLYVCYSISMEFLPSVTSMGESLMDVDEIVSTMFLTCGVLGFFAGLVTGQMAEGRIMSGLKHSIICLLLTYAVFTLLMNY
ncbi:type II secretion system F family protein [Methanococcoides methylutens]|uniref:Transporter n=1 Tax=Methanococcoides methylutens MM1 TaxID=1434104 RepID=A0A0E3X0M4_METMT|nr:type II secretion system F family protein [Methanococcoides methylutens]AKB85869.1 Transporter [Methanococcoides methylutens MM1]